MIKLYSGSDNTFSYHKAIQEIEKENLVKIDLFKDNIERLFDECSSFSLFDDIKNIIVFNCDFLNANKSKNSLSKKEEERLINTLTNLPSSFNLNIVLNTKLINCSLLTELKKLPIKFIQVDELTDNDYYQLFNKLAKENDKKVDKTIYDEFIKRIDKQYLNFINETNKLFTYPDEITLNVVKNLVTLKIEENVFNLCNFICKKDKVNAIKNYRDLRFLNNDPLQLLLIMTSQFRFIYLVKYLNSKKFSNDEIANELSTSGKKVTPGRIYYVLKDNSFNSKEDIENILLKLANIEENIKLNQDNADYLLEMFILNN